MVKALGSEINYVYNNYFPEIYHWDEKESYLKEFLLEDGTLNLNSEEEYDLEDFGLIVDKEDWYNYISFEEYFLKMKAMELWSSVKVPLPEGAILKTISGTLKL
jgi:hypothetical protein